MSVLNLLFSFKGRIGRAKYWLTGLGASVGFGVLLGLYVAVLGVMAPSVDIAAKKLTPASLETNYAAFWPLLLPVLAIFVALIWSILAIYAKRLHDRDKSAVWLFAIFGPALLAFVNPLFVVAYALLSIWFSIEMGFFPGTKGPNRFDVEPSAFKSDVAIGNWEKSGSSNSSSGLGGMEAAMAAINAAARENRNTTIRPPSSPQFGQAAAPQFGRLNAVPPSGGFGRKV